MSHLSPEQFVDVAEGRGDPAAIAHAGACDACRASVNELRDTLELTRTDGAPEPSPLFWDHLAARVGAAVREDAGLRARRTAWLWRWGAVSALGAAALVVALVVVPREPGVNAGREETPAPFTTIDVAAYESGAPGAAGDASWWLMTDLSEELTVDEARAAMPVLAGLGTADRALPHLNDAERAALVEIIHEEIARSSAGRAEPSDQ